MRFALREKASNLIAFARSVRNRSDLRLQSEALENRLKALSRENEQKNIFLCLLAHELRNPLCALTNAVEVIRRGGLVDPTSLTGLQVIDRQTAALHRLIDDLMDTARIAAGKLDLQLQPIDLKDVARVAAASVRRLAQARDQEFEEIFIEGAVLVNADYVRMQQVFANILDNAIKYTPGSGKIILSLSTEGGDAIVRVEDTGIGMAAEIVPKIFELFTQEDSSRKGARGGLGLGLALVRQLVELHGGTVHACSNGRDKGSIFTVRMPLREASKE